MVFSRISWLTVLTLVGCAGCGGSAGPEQSPADAAPADASSSADVTAPVDAGSGEDAASEAGDDAAQPVDDPDPQISAADRSALMGLRYDTSALPADPSNKYADLPAARALGHKLFFDSTLSGRLLERDHDGSAGSLGVAGEAGKISCASCHLPASGFVDTRSPHRQISLGAQWTRRRTPTLLEVASAPLYNWDGRRDSIWAQAIGVFESSQEFNSGRLFIAQQVFKRYRAEYEALFGAMPKLDDAAQFPALTGLQVGCEAGPAETAACRGKPGDKADYDGLSADAKTAVTRATVNTAKAIGAFVRQLRCGPGRFDKWLDGDAAALTRSEQRGAALFVGRANCVKCHSGPNLTDGKFHNVGLRPMTVAVAFTDVDDRGAGEGLPPALTDPLNSAGAFSDGNRHTLPSQVGADMEGAFRTPTLRCIAEQPSFMHTAQLQSLAQVLRFFVRGGDMAGFPGTKEINALDLNEREQADVVAFIAALQGPGPDRALLAPP